MSRVAILHYAAAPVVGGVESVMSQHARLMIEDGHSVVLIAGKGDSVIPGSQFTLIPEIYSKHEEVLSVKESLDRGVVPDGFHVLRDKLKSALKESLEGVDVFFVHNVLVMTKNLALTAAIRDLAAENKSFRLVAWHHDIAATSDRYETEVHSGFPWSLVCEDWPEVNLKHVVVSEKRREELCSLMNLESKQVSVVPSGLDLEEFYQLSDETKGLAQESGLLNAAPLFLLPVRVTRRKNIELALEIVAAIAKRYPRAGLLVTGPPGAHNPANADYLTELLELRGSLGLVNTANSGRASAVFLCELFDRRISDRTIADLFRLADALLMPSSDEGFGIPIIEAGASGLPVFCSDLIPFREIAGDNAFYFSANGQAEPIANEIVEVLSSDKSFNLKLNTKCNYSWEQIYAQSFPHLLDGVV